MDNYNHVSDLGLAASLSARGFVIVKIDKSNPRRVVFCFEKSADLEQVVKSFWSGELLLPATLLLDHIRNLKNRIYS